MPNRFRARMGERVGRQRAMFEEGHLLLVLHELPVAGVHSRQARLFWRDPSGTWRSNAQGSGVGPLRDHLVSGSRRRARRAAARRALGEGLLRGAEVGDAPRTSRNLLRTLLEARDVLDDRELINLRDRAGEVERGAELLVAEAGDSLELTSAQQAEQQAQLTLGLARARHKHNVMTAGFLPMTALASIFSMTLRSGLETSLSPWLFWLVVAAGVGLGLVLKGTLVARAEATKGIE